MNDYQIKLVTQYLTTSMPIVGSNICDEIDNLGGSAHVLREVGMIAEPTYLNLMEALTELDKAHRAVFEAITRFSNEIHVGGTLPASSDPEWPSVINDEAF